jgi:transcriptional regulator with XRE-family HTH domain
MPYKIAEARKAKGWSQQRLADELGTTQQVVYRWEKGINDPRADVMVRMAGILGVTLSYLLGVDDNGDMACSDDERKLLRLYRSTDDRGKAAILAIAESQAGDEGQSSDSEVAGA